MATPHQASDAVGNVIDMPQAGASGGSAVARVAADLVARATPGAPLLVGVTGSVASGKTTFCAALTGRLRHARRVETISTDGFLLSNATLASRDLSRRKGFPESYDVSLMSGLLQRARWGPVEMPGYSHSLYDLDPRLSRTIDRPDILLVEGLGLSPDVRPPNSPPLLDVLIYIDASEENLEAWFITRFLKLWKEAETDRSSFYARFRSMTPTEVFAFARSVWTDINLPNLRDHILSARETADIVLRKDGGHQVIVDRI